MCRAYTWGLGGATPARLPSTSGWVFGQLAAVRVEFSLGCGSIDMDELIATKQQVSLIHGALAFPAFLPDATLGVVRGTDAADLRAAGVRALVMNVFHLMQKPGS